MRRAIRGRLCLAATAVLAGGAVTLVGIGPGYAAPSNGAMSGGALVVGMTTGDVDTLDPSLSRSFSAVEVYRTICEKLYDRNHSEQIVPQLAAALPTISDDKLTYTIQLRQGIRFNDGTPFNAQAVVGSLQRMLTIPGASRASDLGPIDAVAATGPFTVAIHLSSRFTPLLAALSTPASIAMSPTQLAKLGANFGTSPVCVGPFMFDHRVVGDDVTVVKSPYYYDRKDVRLDRIVFKPETDPAAAVAALQAGDLQALDRVASTSLQTVRRDPNLRLLEQASLGWSAILFNIGNKQGVGNLPYTNVGTPLASSPLLRQAFEEAIDRKTLDRVVFDHTAVPGCTPITPASPAFDATIACTAYDPADARKLVVQAGFTNPTVDLLVASSSDNLRLAEFVQAQEAAVGINVVIDPTDSVTALAEATSGDFDAYLISWSGSADTDRNIFQFFASSGVRNDGGYSDPRLDFVLANSRKATSATALKTLYHVAEEILADDRPIVILGYPNVYAAISATVTGVTADSSGVLEVDFAHYG